MKIAVECKSPLLQKSLEFFLSKYLSPNKKSDILIRDVKCLNDARCFYISTDKDADLVKPFSKSQLILALEHRYEMLNKKNTQDDVVKSKDTPLNFDILEKRIQYLTTEYQENILKAVRAFYEE